MWCIMLPTDPIGSFVPPSTNGASPPKRRSYYKGIIKGFIGIIEII